MVFAPAFIIFVLVSLFGTFIVFFSSGLLGVWIGLELGFFGFLPILNGKTVGENEGAVKYFVIQSVGSAVLLLGFLFVVGESLMGDIVSMMMMGGLMIKLGVFPFHFWFPSVMGLSSWFSCFWLSVVQKVGPFWGVSGLGLSFWLIKSFVIFLVLTSVVGAFGGLAQVQFRPLLAYSSLGQTGWMGLVAVLNLELFCLYMVLYMCLLGGLLFSLYMSSFYSVVNVPGSGISKGGFFWVFGGGFFISLSGLPPLAGFTLKLIGVLVIVNKYPVLLMILISMSMVSLYYYLSVFINSVVCVGVGMYGLYDNLLVSKRLAGSVVFVMILNWMGGLPLFVMCGGLVMSGCSLIKMVALGASDSTLCGYPDGFVGWCKGTWSFGL